MWTASIKIKHECIILPKTEKCDIIDSTYMLNSYEKNDHVYYTLVHILSGEEKEKRKFIRLLKADKRVIEIEGKGNQYYTLFKVPKKQEHIASFFNKETFLITPVIHEKGGEIWNVAAWKKELIMDFIKKTEKIGEIRIIKIQQERISDVFIHKIIPHLSQKQKEAIDLAIKSGYYNIPKKIDTNKLATFMKINRITYQEHLRKAEAKLLPFFIQNSA